MKNLMTFSASVQNAFDNDNDKLMAFNKLLIDAAHGSVEGFSAKEANEKIVEKFRAAIGCDATASKAEVRKAIRRNKVELFDIIEETIQDLLITGWDANPFFREYVEVRNIAMGDANEFYVEDDSVLSVMKVSGNHHDMIRQRVGAGKPVSIATSWYGVKIYAEMERLLTGVEDWSTLVKKVVAAYDEYVNELLYKTLVDTGATLGAQWYKSSALSTSTAETLRTLCMDVGIATGHEVVIMGTRAALASVTALQNVSWASDEMKNEYNKTGRMGYWEGIRLVEIPQGFKSNDTSKYLVDNKKLFIMPVADNKFMKLVYEGDAIVTEVSDGATNRDMTVEYEMLTKMGVGVVTNLKFGMWNITT